MKPQATDSVAFGRSIGHDGIHPEQGFEGFVSQVFHFGDFTLDQSGYRLRRGERLLRLEKLPMELLILLAQRRGELVSREQIADQLWGKDVFLDVDHGINTAIRKIRRVLGDDPDTPRFVETVVGKGYRFVAEVVCKDSDTSVGEHPPLPLMEASFPSLPAASTETFVGPAKVESALPRRMLWGMATVVVLLAIVLLLNHRRGAGAATQPTIKSIAVLPLKNLSGDATQEYLADGMTEELIGQLANIHGLRVISRTSMMRFKDTRQSVPEIARALNVDAVLEGSVIREGNLVRVHAQLIRGATDEHIWAQEYEREFGSLLALQQEVAQTIARQVGVSTIPISARSQSADPQAYEACLQAAYFLNRGSEKANYDKALAYANQAIKLDADFSPAWALRSEVLSAMAYDAFIDTNEGVRRARADAEQAIALEPRSAAGYLSLANIRLAYDFDWEGAEAALNKAAALQPGSAELLSSRANLEETRAHLDEAIELRKRAVVLDPLCSFCYLFWGNDLYESGQYDEANTVLQKALEVDPQQGYVHFVQGQILLARGRPQEALMEMQQETNEGLKLAGEAFAYHSLGRQQASHAALRELIATHGSAGAYQIAEVYAYRGEDDKALDWLERAYQQHDSGMTYLKADNLFNNLHQNPRYLELLKKMRLSP